MKLKYKIFWFSFLMAGFQIAHSQPSTFDPNFGTNGFATTTVSGGNEFGVYTAIQSDGKVLQAGNSGTQSVILRYNSNGTLDNTFGTNGLVTKTYGSYSSVITKLTLLNDGKILVSGYYYTNAGLTTYATFLAKYNTDGTPDNTFGTSGIAYISILGNPNFNCGGALAILSSGGILLGGNVRNTDEDIIFVKLNSDGSKDNTFGTSGVVIRNIGFKEVITDLLELPNGQIFAVAYVKINATYYNTGLFKYNADGTTDNTFGTNGYLTHPLSPNLDNYPRSVKLTPTGKIVVGGDVNNGSNYDIMLTRYLLDGSLDNSFNGTGKVVLDLGGNDMGSDSKILKNGQILIVGPTQTTSSYNTTLAKFDTTGQLVTAYGNNGKVTIASGLTLSGPGNQGSGPTVGSGMAITPNESVIYIATSYKVGSSYPFFLAKLGTGTGVTIPVFNPSINYGSASDIDGYTYKTVTIGGQIWFAENLRATKYNDGSSIPLVTSSTIWASLTSPGYSWYNNDKTGIGTDYGALYNFYAVDTKKLCPTGWDVPTNNDWTTLENYVGGTSVVNANLKESGSSHWIFSSTYPALNSSGFTGLPGGFRQLNGVDGGLTYNGNWWSSTGTTNGLAYYRGMNYNSVFPNGAFGAIAGMSVRCIKLIPTTTSTGASNCDLPSKFGFYTINQSTKDLYFVDTLGSFTKIGNTNLKTIGKYRGMDFDANNNLYLLGDLDSLYKISASSGKATFVSKLNQPGLTTSRGRGISFAQNGELYILDEIAGFPQGTLRKFVNLSTGLTTTVGTSTTGLPSILAIEFDNYGTLWATDECCENKLHIINTVSGISTFSAGQALNKSFPSELDHTNGKLYGISIENETTSNTTTFYSINKTNGASTTLFTTTGIYVGLAGRNKPIYTDTTYLTQVVTVTAFQTITVIAFQTVTVTNFQTLTVTSIVTVHDCGTVTGGNLGGRADAASISVYPNPSSSKISVISNGQVVFSVDVLDSRGISILTTYYPSSIDVANWPNGVYLLRAKDEEGVILKTFKISKE